MFISLSLYIYIHTYYIYIYIAGRVPAHPRVPGAAVRGRRPIITIATIDYSSYEYEYGYVSFFYYYYFELLLL